MTGVAIFFLILLCLMLGAVLGIFVAYQFWTRCDQPEKEWIQKPCSLGPERSSVTLTPPGKVQA